MATTARSLPIIEAAACVGRAASAHVATLTGDLTLDASYPNVLKLDAGGAARDVTLPDVAVFSGVTFRVINASDAAENLVIKNAGGDTIATANQNEQAEVYSDGSSWVLLAVTTIALA